MPEPENNERPYGTTFDGSGEMFDGIATRYDRLNRILSLGLDRRWRKKLVRALACSGEAELLDVATGTADVALAIARALPQSRVTGLDPSSGMLEVGRQKVDAAGLAARIELVEGDAQAMTFDDDSFNAACISFGIRNVPDRARGLAEMTRVTRPGGRVVVLELGEPRRGLMAPLARLHMEVIVPRVGAWITGTDAYRYLHQSIAAFPPPDEFLAMMRNAGLTDVRCERLNLGVAHLFVGTTT